MQYVDYNEKCHTQILHSLHISITFLFIKLHIEILSDQARLGIIYFGISFDYFHALSTISLGSKAGPFFFSFFFLFFFLKLPKRRRMLFCYFISTGEQN